MSCSSLLTLPYSRPKTLADITSQGHTTTLLQRTLNATNLPHLLFYGPPGTGKTSTVLALSAQLFGPQLFRSRVLELNASDERGISIVRSKIKDFARQQLSAPPAGPAGVEYRKQYPCPPFKIIVLDEADSMTQDAQSALRRTMETYSKITRFCLVCNYVTRIIDPLASRCSKFRFKSLDSGDAVTRLEDIAKLEGVRLDEGVAQALAKCADGDLRKAITFLQSAARLVAATSKDGGGKLGRGRKKKTTTVQDDDEEGAEDGDAMDIDGGAGKSSGRSTQQAVTIGMVEEIAGVIPDPVLSTLTTAIKLPSKPSPPPQGNVYDAIARSINDIIADGWPAAQLLTQLYASLIFDEVIGDKSKLSMLSVFGEADRRLVDGADEELVLLDTALRCSGCLGGK